MIGTPRIHLPLLLTALLLAACTNYDISVNDNIVYGPSSLFSDYRIEDQALHNCVAQAIADQQLRAADALTELNCSHAGIADLQGLAAFHGLTRLKLSSNQVRNLMELAPLTQLRELYLDDNVVVDPVPLYPLTALRSLDLSGNASLQCPQPGAFDHLTTLALPAHCTEGSAR